MALISFDLDGVLQRNPFHAGSPHGVFGHLQRELAPHHPDYATDVEGATKAALRLLLTEHQERLHGGRMVEAFDWDGIVATVAARLGHPGGLDVTALVTQYAVNPTLAYAHPGAAACLEALKQAGHTLITITNGYRTYQEPVLKQLGILHYFSAMVTPEAAGAAKPQAGIFRAAEAHGPAPRIHIGDTLPHDVAGAKRAGWLAIYIIQPSAPGFTPMSPALAALPPWERPAAGLDWLTERLALDKRFHGFPPAELHECTPDAIVHSLDEVPATVRQIGSGRQPS